MTSNYLLYLYTLPKEEQLKQILIILIFLLLLTLLATFLDFILSKKALKNKSILSFFDKFKKNRKE